MSRAFTFPRRWQFVIQAWRDLDWSLMGLTGALTLIGGLTIRSTQVNVGLIEWWQHLLAGGVGLVLALAIARWGYEHLLQWHWVVYGLTCLSLLAVKFFGVEALGAQRWINIGGFHLQPSEFAKVGIIITLAALLHENTASNIPSMVRALLITGLPWAIVFLQPDLGTSLVFGAIALGMLYWGNANPGWLLLMVSPLVSAILFNLGLLDFSQVGVPSVSGFPTQLLPVETDTLNAFFLLWIVWVIGMAITGWQTLPWPWSGMVGALCVNLVSGDLGHVLWGLLKDYQKDRLILFLDPDKDPLGGGYHLIQSRIAIGAGGLWGQGIQQGTQTQLGFIPEQHTDFIFSAVGEEWGLVGCLFVLLLYWGVCLRLVLIALSARENFGSLLTIGVLAMLVFQVVINISMTIGLAPVTGIPLPWMSYGRSAMLTNFIAIGLVESVARQRQLRSRY